MKKNISELLTNKLVSEWLEVMEYTAEYSDSEEVYLHCNYDDNNDIIQDYVGLCEYLIGYIEERIFLWKSVLFEFEDENKELLESLNKELKEIKKLKNISLLEVKI